MSVVMRRRPHIAQVVTGRRVQTWAVSATTLFVLASANTFGCNERSNEKPEVERPSKPRDRDTKPRDAAVVHSLDAGVVSTFFDARVSAVAPDAALASSSDVEETSAQVSSAPNLDAGMMTGEPSTSTNDAAVEQQDASLGPFAWQLPEGFPA